MEKELREYLIYSGQGAFYEDMMEERKRIRRYRQNEMRRKAQAKAFWIDVAALVFGIGISIFVITGLITVIVS